MVPSPGHGGTLWTAAAEGASATADAALASGVSRRGVLAKAVSHRACGGLPPHPAGTLRQALAALACGPDGLEPPGFRLVANRCRGDSLPTGVH